MRINAHDLASLITQQIRKVLNNEKRAQMAQVTEIQSKTNGGYRAKVLIYGAEKQTVFLEILNGYTPALNDRVLLVYPDRDGVDQPSPIIINKIQ